MISLIGGTVVRFVLSGGSGAVVGGGNVGSDSSFIVTFPKGIIGTLQGAK